MISPIEIWMVRMREGQSSFVPCTHPSHFDHMIDARTAGWQLG